MSNYNYNPYNPYYPSQSVPVSLNGYLVDSIDTARNANIPIGGYGVFPKNDLSEIYIKSWNNNGTINMLTYKLSDGQPNTPENDLTQINEKLNTLIEKIDTLL